MSIDKIIVTIMGIVGISFTYWFFLMKKDQEVVASNAIDIVVEGGYSPAVISISKGKKTTLNFFRKDPTDCLEEVILSDFKIKKYLPLNKKISIEITPKEKGEYRFSCGMNMYHGKIIVR